MNYANSYTPHQIQKSYIHLDLSIDRHRQKDRSLDSIRI